MSRKRRFARNIETPDGSHRVVMVNRPKRKYVKSGKYSKKCRPGCCTSTGTDKMTDRARIEDPIKRYTLPMRRVTITTLVISIFPDCPRCGKLHQDMVFIPFMKPVVVGAARYDHFGYCPDTREPIIFDSTGDQETGPELDAVQDRREDAAREAYEALREMHRHARNS